MILPDLTRRLVLYILFHLKYPQATIYDSLQVLRASTPVPARDTIRVPLQIQLIYIVLARQFLREKYTLRSLQF
jgi:hypothetical protein